MRSSVAAALALFIVGGCGSTDTDNDNGNHADTGSYSNLNSESEHGLSPASEAECPREYPLRLTVTTDVPEEMAHLKEVLACTADEQYGPVVLVNVGEAVWVPSTPDPVNVTWETDTLSAEVFRSDLSQSALLVPGTAMLVPAPPTDLSWTLDQALSVAWQAYQGGIEALKDSGEEQLTNALARGSARRRALLSCALAAYHAADPSPSADPTDALADVWGNAAGGGRCALDWRRADEEVRREGLPATTWDEATRWSEDVHFLERVDKRITWINRATKLVQALR